MLPLSEALFVNNLKFYNFKKTEAHVGIGRIKRIQGAGVRR
jgi:hypothetical protein